MFDRRFLLKLGAGVIAASAVPALRGEETAARFTVSEDVLARVPSDFNGLSYESPQLANPRFFSAANKPLVSLFRELAPTGGVLRLGGNLSAFTGWRNDLSVPLTEPELAMMERGKKYWEWDLTDPSIRNGNRQAVFHPECIRALSSFLDATGWKLIYGLNFAQGTPAQAAAEAACVQKTVGKRLLAFQLGNEDDFWRGGFRSKEWEFGPFDAEWKEWVKAIRQQASAAPFAGPDVAVRLDWVEQMAASEGHNLAFASAHHYAMGPAGDPRMTAEHLFGPDPEIAREIATAKRIAAGSGLAFRNAECNSCFHGGQKGVSDAYASALWGAGYMLTLAQAGHAGVNLHGGGNGIYSPIVGNEQDGFVRRPLYFGMQLAQTFCGMGMLQANLSGAPPSLSAFAGKKDGAYVIALLNKGKADTAVIVSLPEHAASKKLHQAWALTGESLTSSTGVKFAPLPDPEIHSFRVEINVPASAGLVLQYS